MRVLAFHRHLIPALRQRVGHHAQLQALVLQLRPLLDMQFEVGAELLQLRRVGAALPADAAQLLAEDLALRVLLGQHFGLGEDAHRRAAAHHRWREAGALLVGPIDQHQRRLGLCPGLVQRAHHLQPGQHAQNAVELAARRLRVQMAADGDRLARRIAARPAEDHVADAIDAQRQPGRLAPALEQRPALAIQIGQRLPVAAALGGAADAGDLHQAVPQSRAAQRDVRRHRAFLFVHQPASFRPPRN